MELKQPHSAITGMAQRVQQGQDAPKTAALEALRNIQEIDGALHAWAFAAESIIAPALPSDDTAWSGPLAGVPLGVKDVIDVAGMPTRCGSAACNDAPAQFDAAAVAMLRAAGAIPIGKTVTAEFAYRSPGPTRNPVNMAYTPGGSSSGSAAAVAAGMVPIALGTQTGGSIIRPAAFCGVVGFKPTFGAVHRDGIKLTCDSLDTIGWYGKTVADVATVAQVLLPHCAQAQGEPLLPLGQEPGLALGGQRIVQLPCLVPGHEADAEAQDALDSAATALRNAGVEVSVMAPFAALGQLMEAHSVIMRYEFSRSLAPVARQHADKLSAALLEAVASGSRIPARQYLDMKSLQAEYRGGWSKLFDEADLILTPSAPGAAPQGLDTTGSSRFNSIWTLLGWPCLHLPTSFSKQGLPLGVQLVGKPDADAGLLALAQGVHQIVDRRSD